MAACRAADERGRQAPPAKPEQPRPTPQTNIEAVWYCVRTRGLDALKEPPNVERLKTFDATADKELNTRIERHFRKEVADAA
jgi:hypothetical protein